MTRHLVLIAALSLALPAPAPAATTPLDSGWQLLVDPSGRLAPQDVASMPGWRDVKVGLSWNAQFEDLRDYMGVAWYRVTFAVPGAARGGHVRIRFGAVDYFAEVFVNGRPAGTHEGGYTPFTIDATPLVRSGQNDLLVRVTDPPPTPTGGTPRFPEYPYDELPVGKQNWYIHTGGLWQPVTLDVRPALFVERVGVAAKNSGAMTITVDVAGSTPGRAAQLRVTARDAAGRQVFRSATTTVRGPGPVVVEGRVASPRLWSPDQPALYTVVAELTGPVLDRQESRFGFREFEARDGRMYLNGEPIYMIGALDQDFYPDTIYSTPGREYLRDMMRAGRKIGLNLLRCHIKVCDPAYLDAADEVGMLVWYEVPSWGRWTDASVARGRKILDAMVARDANHPSIVIASLINEAWGIDMTQADQRAGLLRWYDEAKPKVAAAGWLLVDNSPCCSNFHLKTDLDDFHQYFSIPDNADRWDRWVADFASRPAWAFSSHGDAVRTGKEPLIVSEFGNWGLPALPSELPWWFERDFDGRTITRPAGLFDRFHGYGFDRVFRDYATLAQETQWRQWASLKHEIETMRRHPSIQGYVITEFTDINWEANGLLDMWRQPKAYANLLGALQQQDVLVPVSERRNFTSGEPVEVAVLLSQSSARDLTGAGWTYRTQSGGDASPRAALAARPASGTTVEIGRIRFAAPAVTEPRRERITMELVGAGGDVLATNVHDVYVFPARRTPSLDVTLHDPAGALHALAGSLSAGGVRIDSGLPSEDRLLLTSAVDATVRRHLEGGGRALVLLGTPVRGQLAAAPGLTLAERRGELDGNWVSNFPWMHVGHPALSPAGISRVTGFEAQSVTPRWLLAGVPDRAYAGGDVLAGMFFGWINQMHATAAQFRAGDGRALLTTFRFDEYGRDPFATHLLDGMLRHVSGDGFAPAVFLP